MFLKFYALIYNAHYYRDTVPTAAITWNFLTFMQLKFQTQCCCFIVCWITRPHPDSVFEAVRDLPNGVLKWVLFEIWNSYAYISTQQKQCLMEKEALKTFNRCIPFLFTLVLDDEDSNNITVGSLVTVLVTLTRQTMAVSIENTCSSRVIANIF